MQQRIVLSSSLRHLAAGLSIAGLLAVVSVRADEPKSKVHVVYIHGTNTRPGPDSNQPGFIERARELHTRVLKTTLAGHSVAPEPVIITWWDLAQQQDCWYRGGVDRLHTQEGAGSWYVRPKHVAPGLRDLIHDVTHDAFWLLTNKENLDAVLNRVEQELDKRVQAGDPYIIIGHSAGSLVAYKFLQERLFMASARQPQGKFLGLVTIGCPVNTFLSTHVEKDSQGGFLAVDANPAADRPFWLNVSHHNDAIATSLNPVLTGTPGRKVRCTDVVVRRTIWERLPLIKEITYGKSHVWAAHGWYFAKPKTFARTMERAVAEMQSHP
jgi:hypothetical protein